jgi:uncharacterized protein (TIGR00255 family)
LAIASMTGFAREAGATGPYQWAWEIKSVNGRGLDVRVRMPPGFDALGEEARAALQKALVRGQCQLGLNLTRAAGSARVRINREVLDSLLSTLRETAVPEGVRPASMDGLLAVRGVVEIEETDDAEVQAALAADLRAAIPGLVRGLVEARLSEGRALNEVVAGQLDTMEALDLAADGHPGRRPEAIRERLAAQVSALMDTGVPLDPGRLHQEAALLAARADIREELDRLRAHVASAREMLGQGGAVGRKLDFLAQEFGREANTLCAKANDVALSRLGLDLKAVVEQFREQVQNVE